MDTRRIKRCSEQALSPIVYQRTKKRRQTKTVVAGDDFWTATNEWSIFVKQQPMAVGTTGHSSAILGRLLAYGFQPPGLDPFPWTLSLLLQEYLGHPFVLTFCARMMHVGVRTVFAEFLDYARRCLSVYNDLVDKDGTALWNSGTLYVYDPRSSDAMSVSTLRKSASDLLESITCLPVCVFRIVDQILGGVNEKCMLKCVTNAINCGNCALIDEFVAKHMHMDGWGNVLFDAARNAAFSSRQYPELWSIKHLPCWWTLMSHIETSGIVYSVVSQIMITDLSASIELLFQHATRFRTVIDTFCSDAPPSRFESLVAACRDRRSQLVLCPPVSL